MNRLIPYMSSKTLCNMAYAYNVFLYDKFKNRVPKPVDKEIDPKLFPPKVDDIYHLPPFTDDAWYTALQDKNIPRPQ